MESVELRAELSCRWPELVRVFISLNGVEGIVDCVVIRSGGCDGIVFVGVVVCNVVFVCCCCCYRW